MPTQVHDLKRNRQSLTMTTESSQVVVRWSSTWNRLFTGTRIGGLNTWEVTDADKAPEVLHQGQVHTGSINDLEFITPHNSIATAGADGEIAVTSVHTGQIIRKFQAPKQFAIHSLSYDSEHQYLMSGSTEKQPMLWILNAPTITTPFTLIDDRCAHHNSLVAVYAVPQSPQLISLDSDGLLKIWDVRTFGCVQNIVCGRMMNEKLQDNIAPVSLMERRHFPWRGMLYVGANKQLITFTKRRMYAFQNGAAEKDLTEVGEGLLSLGADSHTLAAHYNPHDRSWITCTHSKVRVWNAVTGRISSEYEVCAQIRNLLFIV